MNQHQQRVIEYLRKKITFSENRSADAECDLAMISAGD
jgi:hypothetical protein